MAYIGNAPADRFTSIPTVQQFNGDGSTTAFTLSRPVGTDQDLLVSVDGVIQDTAAYAVSNGTTLTFSAAPSTGTANIFVNYLGVTIGSVVHPASSSISAAGASLDGAVTINDSSADVDFRVESNGGTHTLFVDGGNDAVGLGSSRTDRGLLNVNHDNTGDAFSGSHIALTYDVAPTDNDSKAGITYATSDSDNYGYFQGAERTTSGHGAFVLRYHNNSAGGTKVMEVDSNGAVTKPLQPAFWVRPASTQSNFAADGSTVTVVWGTETYDVNADFASNTFTAPVTGKYFMHVRLNLQSIDRTASYYQVNIVTSNSSHSFIQDPRGLDTDPNHFVFNVSAVADMDASDTATVTIVQPNGTAQTDIIHTSSYSSWYGYLLG